MEQSNLIEQKLQQFSRKYYTNELIKGTILFVVLGFLYFFFTLFIEHFLWLKPASRTLLFWVFILIELLLLIRFIGFPIFKLVGLQKGISFKESSKIIGNHFPEVKDKLLNVLQLKENDFQSDLLMASIRQKTEELKPVPFTKAISFKSNTKYLKYALIPVLIWLVTLVTGTNKELSNSLQRFVNHEVAYTPPAPFSFSLTNNNLEVIQGKPLTIYVEVKGEVIPQEAKILYENQQYFLQNEGNGFFSYTFSEINKPIDFYLAANKVQSENYRINTIKTPTIQNVSMLLMYPKYLGKRNEVTPNTGNVTIPQGTAIKWTIKAVETETVSFINEEKRSNFTKKETNKFVFSKQILKNTNYQIATSNKKLKDYEKLQFSVEVIKDENPTISVKSNIDSISRGTAFFAGQIADDYGISKLELVYYDIQNPQNQQIKNISVTKENVQTFFYEFPNGLSLKKGVNYEMYFQVFDNDAVSGRKKATSQKFSYRQKTKEEVKEELLQEQRNYIQNLENSLNKQQKSKKELEKIQFELQKKKNINWNDQKKIQNLVKRQQQYKQMMQRQTEKLQENFTEKKEESKELQEKKEDIKKRIEELKKLEKQQKLLDELLKTVDKLKKDELIKKAKELAQQNKQQERSLERILEMTKQFYVQQKTEQIAKKLEELAKKQEELANKNATKKEQEAIKKEFDALKKEMKDLQKDNEALKNPMDIPSMEELQRDTQKELNKAEENLEQNNQQKAKKNQQKAKKNMQKMSSKMQESMQTMSSKMEEENMEDMRQVLKNLITFSFDQENLMSIFSKNTSSSHPNFGKNLKKQFELKTYFEHIDDSLFTLSMRVPKISSVIQNHLGTAHYNLNQSLENFAEGNFMNGIKNQRYVMTSANELADMLSNTLDAMQNPKQGSGKGKGKGESFSLPDIIQKQSDLLKKMQQGMDKKGKSGKKGKGKKQGNNNGKQGNKEGESEQMNGELYQIYKEQSELRQQLENAIKKGGAGVGKAKKALKKMEELENEIINKGFNRGTLNRMQQLNYELLKLDKATFEQGEDKKRKSETNYKQYNKQTIEKLKFKKQYYNQTEILNRQSLPLQQDYKKKVKEYFKSTIE